MSVITGSAVIAGESRDSPPTVAVSMRVTLNVNRQEVRAM